MRIELWTVCCFLTLGLALPGCQCLDSSAGDDTSIPPADIDRLAMTVTLDIEIAGIGRDEVVLEGDVGVQRTGPYGTTGTSMVGELISATFRGKSDVFGEIIAVESPIRHSRCEYEFKGPGEYEGRFLIYGWFWLPQHELVVFSDEAVTIEGPAAGIPPIGQKAVMPDGEISLHSFQHATGNPIGTLFKATGEIGGPIDVEAALARPETTVSALLGGN